MHLLIADDDPTARQILEHHTRQWDYSVEICADGHSAWRALTADDPPRIAILDWMMPGADGPDICRRLARLEDRPLTWVILLTGRTQREDVSAGLDSGAHDFLRKPVDPQELRSRVAVGRRMVRAEDRLREALGQIRTLRGLLPICANCKSIREDQGYWTRIEDYICRHSDADFSHSVCPKCMVELYPEIYPNGLPEGR